MEVIRTYRNGELVEVTQVDANFPTPSNVSGFITQMMISQSYNRLAFTTNNQIARSRLEIAITRLELKPSITDSDLALLKTIWNIVVDATADLTVNDLNEWNQIATQNHMPFAFDEDFKMQLNV
ncbi:hypothetical protein [Calothrix sp. PCC 7507]|uniref:hypothetical protein n=1 Tax=Calothrix sp. PCC 7507 TaxID=99598 RepID=UPI00029EE0B5|nr:hypothetical protein [Calothrix sp. PCC 7507]AFY31600.1 hypothetical protein Cal7507_1126 [Calothrix sp. PCC 7507]